MMKRKTEVNMDYARNNICVQVVNTEMPAASRTEEKTLLW